MTCYQYIVFKPLRAGLGSQSNYYLWLSEARQAAYRDMLNICLSESEVVAIREANSKVWGLGDDRFKAKITALVERRVSPLLKGRSRKKSVAAPDLHGACYK